MPTVNGPDEITTLDAGDDKVFFSDSNGDVKEVALGASGEVLTSAGPTADPTFSAIPAEPTVGADKIMYSNSSDVVSGVALGASGTVLTSAGLTSAPSWEAIAAGGNVYTTTTGDAVAIAVGDIVNLKSDGTVVKIQTTFSAGMSIGTNQGSIVLHSYYQALMRGDAIEAAGTQWHIGVINDSGTQRAGVIPYSVDNAPSQTQGTAQFVTGTNSDISTSYSPMSIQWDSTNSKLVAIWQAVAGYIYSSIGTISGTGSTATVSWTAPIFLWGINIDFADLVDTAGANGGLCAFFRNTATGQGYTLNIIMNGSATGWSTTNSASLGNYIPAPNTGGAGQDDVRQPSAASFNTTTASSGSGTCLYEYWDSNSNIFYSSTITLSGGVTGTWVFSNFFNNNYWSGGNLTPSGLNNMYDPVSQRFITHIVTGNGDTSFREAVLLKYADQSTITHHDQIYYSGSDAVGNLYQVTSGYGSSGYYNARPPIARNSLGDIIIVWDSGGVYRCTLLTVTGTTIERAGLAGSTSTVPASPWGYSTYWTPVIPPYVTGDTFLLTSTGTGGTLYYRALSTQIATTPANEYLGFSRTAVTGAGLAIEVNVQGSIDENQTGLTAGLNYFVQNDGTLGTGAIVDRDIGRALSATKMLVTGTGTGTI